MQAQGALFIIKAAKLRQLLDSDFFFFMSCHHSDGIGNSISDSIPIKPFVELFASLDSGRPQELCASLTMKKRVDITISWILYHKDVSPGFLYAWSLPNMG